MVNGAEAGENGAEGMRLVRPRALLLTAAAPEKEGTPARQRAWRLLDLVRQTHEVHLLVRMDGPVSYDHWRALSRLTRELTLTPHGRLLTGNRAVADTVLTWAAQAPFDALVCGEAKLWWMLDKVAARIRFCDGRHGLDMLTAALAPPTEATAGFAIAPRQRRAA